VLLLHANLQTWLAPAFDDEGGQGLVEYALILALIALVALVALTLLGGNVSSVLSTLASSTP
jgi:pilus assembly protein Flp/PilA